jgi:hypothetical protein
MTYDRHDGLVRDESVDIQGLPSTFVLKRKVYVLECEKVVCCCVLAEISMGLHEESPITRE